MENSVAIVKPKLSAAEQKIIDMVVDGLPSENSRRAYQRHLEDFFIWCKPPVIDTKLDYSFRLEFL